MKILILSHVRSLNKAKAFILNWSQYHELVLITERQISQNKSYVQNCHRLIVENFREEEIIGQIQSCDFILTISENLLPLQVRLEKFYGLTQLSEKAALVLSNKYFFDSHCEQSGLKLFVPPSVIPQNEKDFFKISGPVILKSTIGTGCYPMLAAFESQFKGLDYKVWSSSLEFLSYLKSHQLLEFFLKLNRDGFQSQRFNNVAAHMLLQKYIPSEEPSYAPCGFIKDGLVQICFYVRNQKVCADEHVESDNPPHFAKIPNGNIGDFSVTSVAVEDVPEKLHRSIMEYLQVLVKSLGIRQLFFSGPDFHVLENQLYAIDFNPRPGHFFNLIDQENKGAFTRLFLGEGREDFLTRLRWTTVRLPSGAFLNREQMDQISYCMSEEMRQIDFSQLPEFQFLQSTTRSLQIIATGSSEQELQQDLNHKLQIILAMVAKNITQDHKSLS